MRDVSLGGHWGPEQLCLFSGPGMVPKVYYITGKSSTIEWHPTSLDAVCLFNLSKYYWREGDICAVREQFALVGSFPPSWGLKGSESGHQAWGQAL